MKKYIFSPIGSALIVPGFGQVLNGQIKKGLILMGIVFIIFIVGTFKLIRLITSVSGDTNIKFSDVPMLKAVLISFLIVWTYSVIDAFINGIKIDKGQNQ